MEKIRVGIIGCGGRCQSHIHSLLQMDDVEIVAIAEPVEERRLAGSQKTGTKRLYKDHNELFAHENHDTLDVLYICVEPAGREALRAARKRRHRAGRDLSARKREGYSRPGAGGEGLRRGFRGRGAGRSAGPGRG